MSRIPLVSVIIPVYNRADLISRAIQSALSQSYKNLEVLVIDDCSQDSTSAVVTGFKDTRIRYIRHEQNQGEGASRNTGMREASGKYAAFLDSDDEWLPSKLTRQISLLESEDAALCSCQCYLETSKGEYTIRPQTAYQGGNLLRYLLYESQAAMQPSGLVVHQNYWLPFETTFKVHTDWDWLYRVHNTTDRFVYVSDPLYFFHSDALMRESEHGLSLISKAEPFLERYKQFLENEPKIRRRLAASYANHALLQGNKQQSRAILRRFRTYPSLLQRPRVIRMWWDSLF
jgi:O-antigen biosynthesis protein